MSILSWGKGLLETTTSTNGAVDAKATWATIDTPKDGTLKLNATAGTETTATEEGGDIVDVRNAKTTFQLEWDNFVKKGVKLPWEDTDGIISGEVAFRYTPEDTATEGFLIERAVVHAETSYSTADGKLVHYAARCLKPATGKTVKPYTKTTTAS